jgi:hypothetical protein
MNEKKSRKMDEGDRRRWQQSAYLTFNELKALEMLGSSKYPYNGVSNALRNGLGMLVRMKHPELMQYLRADLKEVP